MPDGTRRLLIRSAGILVILVALGAVLLPLAEQLSAGEVIGWMLLTGGLLELAASAVRYRHRVSAFLASGATILAGLRLLLDPSATFFEILNLVIFWLIVRTAAIAFAVYSARNSLAPWLAFSAGVDFLLAIALLAGLPIAILVVGLFGPTTPIIATFAWVIGVSFISTGALLLATASLEQRSPPS